MTVYPVAQITKLPPPSPIPSVIFEGAVHWQMCGEHQLTEFTYPAHVPVKDRLPNVQELSGVLAISLASQGLLCSLQGM